MSKVLVTEDYLQDIADAIREKLGVTDQYLPSEMAEAILSISGGGGGGDAQVSTGTFVSASDQYGIVDIDCGFKPDLVMVTLPFGSNDTTSYWWKDASWAETSALWCLRPAENNAYVVALGRTTGKTGIQAINDNGFSFMVNGSNTRGVTCKYVAIRGDGGSVVLKEKTITANGEYLASNDNCTGYSKVTVNVPSGGGSIGQAIRIIEDKWDGTGSTTYTFDKDIDNCLLILTYTRETTLSDTRYTLTLASGSYTVNFDSGVIHGSTTYERVVYLLVSGIKTGDTLYVYNYGDLRTADMIEIS